MDSLVMDTPVGRIRLLAEGERLAAIERTSAKAGALGATSPVLRAARDQLREYFDGQRTSFDLPLAPAATPFQQKVRRALMKIPFGKTATYAQIAKAVGTKSPRAVGQAVGANPLLVIVPCHRIVASTGLGGFAWGLPAKKRLLGHEA
ncbi:MAG: methylated-DNA--[protein]-cysteine S-methyltransferase [Candidatus Peribacteraceae bacterium]|nr:methylated-DNA--[protein]-cysteine S-methyltransferase [Candidatus Peribacteraceae bacterium]